jgi:hypothetical protein
MAKTADPVFGSAASRGTWPVFFLDRLRVWRLWRRTRCALTNGVGASHVVVDIRLAKKRRDGARLLRQGSARGLVPNTRNGVRGNGARPCAANGNGHTDPREADRTRAGRTQARRPRQFGCVDICHVGHLPPEWSTTSPRTCEKPKRCPGKGQQFFDLGLCDHDSGGPERIRPSCITDTTSSPASVNTWPRARPRAPKATGDSCA